MQLALLIVLILIIIATLPAWPYSRSWGYFPSGSAGLILLGIVVLLVMGVL